MGAYEGAHKDWGAHKATSDQGSEMLSMRHSLKQTDLEGK